VHDGKTILYRASKFDCDPCPLKPTCCPNTPCRKIPRDVHEADATRQDVSSHDETLTKELQGRLEAVEHEPEELQNENMQLKIARTKGKVPLFVIGVDAAKDGFDTLTLVGRSLFAVCWRRHKFRASFPIGSLEGSASRAAPQSQEKIMRGLLLIVAFALAAVPAAAQASNRKWVQSGKEDPYGTICVDQNSIVKRADGLTQYDDRGCEGKDDEIRVSFINCNEDMSGAKFMIKSRPYNAGKNGKYNWSELNTDSTSMSGQSAKFVCHK
jgi:hypothetical protein